MESYEEINGMKFYRNKYGTLIGKTHRQCAKCGEIFEIENNNTLCINCEQTRRLKYVNTGNNDTINKIIIDDVELFKNRNGNYVCKTHRICTNCGELFKRTNSMSICKKCNTNRIKTNSIRSKMYRRAKYRAKNNNLEFNIDIVDIIIPKYCPILGIPLIANSGKSGGIKTSPSLDRIDSNKGYTKDNIWVISLLANQMKSQANNSELLKFAQWIINNISNQT